MSKKKIDKQWFVQRSHYHFVIEPHHAQPCWQVTETNRRTLVPDFAARLVSIGGKQIECEQTEHWLFALTVSEQELVSKLEEAVRLAEEERERLAVLLETRQLVFEAKVLPSATGGWVVALHTQTTDGIVVPVRLPEPEQGDQVAPAFQKRQDAEAYASYLQTSYACPRKEP